MNKEGQTSHDAVPLNSELYIINMNIHLQQRERMKTIMYILNILTYSLLNLTQKQQYMPI